VEWLELTSDADVQVTDGSIVVDFGLDVSDPRLVLNGDTFMASTPAELGAALVAAQLDAPDFILGARYAVSVEGSRLILSPDPGVDSPAGALLTGAELEGTRAKAHRVVNSWSDAWPMASQLAALDVKQLDGLIRDEPWGGPLVVSMPRTGSTLLGVLMLFCRDASSPDGYRFRRYIHEPAAPIFWSGAEVGAVVDYIANPLSGRDVIQESAYQFAHPELAKWFLSLARRPVVFTMRHPQLAWPSRWRAMLAKMLSEHPDDVDAVAARRALSKDDFSDIGHYLTQRVLPADNGFYAFIALLDLCLQENIDFVLIDNTRFRDHPKATLAELCDRLGFEFDDDMTTWTNLERVSHRVVMSDLALGEEYPWYYAGTLGSSHGIVAESHRPLDLDRFPAELVGSSNTLLTVEEAATWYELLLARPETLD